MRIPGPTLLEKLYRELSVEIGAGIKALLETKHLYQNLELHPKIISEITKILKGTDQMLNSVAQKYFEIVTGFWRLPSYTGIMPSSNTLFEISLNTIKVFCTFCDRIEPFHPSEHKVFNLENDDKGKKQNFVFEYECQSCKGKIVFMVRREGFKLMLTGRSPIEHIPISPVIPKPHKKYFSDAIIAHNSGQTLAGLFLLRTFIEQYTRGLSKEPNQLCR